MNQIAQNLANQSNGSTDKLINGIKEMPIAKIYQQMQYLQTHVLPQALQKLGADSESYKFYQGLLHSLAWAIYVQEELNFLKLKYSRERVVGKIFKDMYEAMEKELQRYTTLEQLYAQMATDSIKDGMVNNALDIVRAQQK